MSQEMRYQITTQGMCCGYDTELFDSLDKLALECDDGIVIMQVKEDCGHWDSKVRYELHNIELYEIAEYLHRWSVDTLDSDRFIVWTDGVNEKYGEDDMLKILERKVVAE